MRRDRGPVASMTAAAPRPLKLAPSAPFPQNYAVFCPLVPGNPTLGRERQASFIFITAGVCKCDTGSNFGRSGQTSLGGELHPSPRR
jgi:hypothetical protein